MYQIHTFYTLNLQYSVICQIYLKNHPIKFDYYVMDIAIGTEGTVVNKTDTNPYLHNLYNLLEDFFRPSTWKRISQKYTACY